MPIPKPKKGEMKKDFMERCMTDEVMNKEYSNTLQRLAVCETQWKESKK